MVLPTPPSQPWQVRRQIVTFHRTSHRMSHRAFDIDSASEFRKLAIVDGFGLHQWNATAAVGPIQLVLRATVSNIDARFQQPPSLHACISMSLQHVYMYVCTHVLACVYTHIYSHFHTRAYAYVHTHVYPHVFAKCLCTCL